MGSKKTKHQKRKKQLAGSFAQDICTAVTNGQWVMPKHLLLGMSVRYLTGSAELITVLNRFGHCAFYSVLLELETAMCSSIEQRQSATPPSVVPDQNSFIHLCWDNFDLTEKTPSGASTTHTAHGIVIQEMFTSADSYACSDQQSLPKDKKRSVTVVRYEIEPYYTKKRAEPNSDNHDTETINC